MSFFLVTDSDVIKFTIEQIFPCSHQASFDSPTVHGNIVPGQLMGAGGLLLKHIPVPNGCGQSDNRRVGVSRRKVPGTSKEDTGFPSPLCRRTALWALASKQAT